MLKRRFSLCLLLSLIAGAAGCVGGSALVRRDTAEVQLRSPAAAIAWYGPAADGDARVLARWRAAVGAPLVRLAPAANSAAADAITIVSWNTALGAGDVVGFVNALPKPRGPLVLLLQEVYRGGPEVPAPVGKAAAFARRHGGAAGGARFKQIEAIADALDLGVYYVPSMRNGGSRTSDEDRGNAILSDLPLTGLTAIELPFEHQRRVAIAATISGRTTTGAPWHVRLVCVHLDNTGSVKRAWIGAEYARIRQARALTALRQDGEPMILAGDFNTWFGFADQAYIETARAFPATRVMDRRRTFRGLLRLDHMFFQLAPGWRAEFRRADRRFGSDHSPLVGTVRFN